MRERTLNNSWRKSGASARCGRAPAVAYVSISIDAPVNTSAHVSLWTLEAGRVILSLGAAAQELRPEKCRVGVRVKAPARFDAQPALVDIIPFEFVRKSLGARIA